MLMSSISFQLSDSRLVYNFINVVLGYQDASSTFVRVHHRLWMRTAKLAGSLMILWVTRTLIAKQF